MEPALRACACSRARVRKAMACIGFLWVHADSFLHNVASPFRSFVIAVEQIACCSLCRRRADAWVFHCKHFRPQKRPPPGREEWSTWHEHFYHSYTPITAALANMPNVQAKSATDLVAVASGRELVSKQEYV